MDLKIIITDERVQICKDAVKPKNLEDVSEEQSSV